MKPTTLFNGVRFLNRRTFCRQYFINFLKLIGRQLDRFLFSVVEMNDDDVRVFPDLNTQITRLLQNGMLRR